MQDITVRIWFPNLHWRIVDFQRCVSFGIQQSDSDIDRQIDIGIHLSISFFRFFPENRINRMWIHRERDERFITRDWLTRWWRLAGLTLQCRPAAWRPRTATVQMKFKDSLLDNFLSLGEEGALCYIQPFNWLGEAHPPSGGWSALLCGLRC